MKHILSCLYYNHNEYSYFIQSNILKKIFYVTFLFLLIIQSIISHRVKYEKFSQINYRDQYEQCQKDYEKMYGMMNKKLKEYSDSESNLLTNVRQTILKTFEKEEKIKSSMDKSLRNCKKDLEDIQGATEKAMKFYKELNEKIRKEIDDIKIEMEKINKERLTCKNDLDESVKIRGALENEIHKAKNEVDIVRNDSRKTNVNVNNRLKDCENKINDIENRKYQETKGNRIDFTKLDSKIKSIENKIEKTQEEGKHLINSHLTKGIKLKENLNLIDDKIKTIIDLLPDLQKESNSNQIKKELSYIKSNLNKISLTLGNDKPLNSSNENDEFPDNIFIEKKDYHLKSEDKNLDENFTKGLNTKFDDETIFLETSNKAQSREIRLIKNSNELSKFNEEENKLKKNLDKILFENIDQTRLIYKKIELFGNLLVDAVKQKTMCDNKYQNLTKENLILKSAVITRNEVNKKFNDIS